jgi:flagellar basal body-associated protein FliL
MTRDSQYQKMMARKAQLLQVQPTTELLNEMHPDDPIRPVVAVMAVVQADVSAVKEQLSESLRNAEAQALSGGQLSTLRSQIQEAIQESAQDLSDARFRDYGKEIIFTLVTTMVVFSFAGMAIGAWWSERRSESARRYWDWNHQLIYECQKQDKKTCNIHVVPPEQW